MATINLNSIQDFFEAGINYCASKVRDITPIMPYSFMHFKQMLYAFTKTEEAVLLPNKPKVQHLKNIPNYALADTAIDFEELIQMHNEAPISNGIYYIVLADLVGSTKYLSMHGNEKAAERIINFVQASLAAFVSIEKVNKAYFLKEVGDSVLFIFTHVSDIIKWHQAFGLILERKSLHLAEPYEIRTCVHLGEVCLHDANPLCLSVSETFKMEKQVTGGKMVFSELAARVASPSLKGNKYILQKYAFNGLKSTMQELVEVCNSKKAPS
jgi:hypothetical protein